MAVQALTIQIIEEMPWVYDIETDIRYKQGIEKGIEEGIEKGEKLKAIETAAKAFQKGLGLDFVMELTGLEKDELLQIQKRVEKGEVSFHQKKKNGSHKKNG